MFTNLNLHTWLSLFFLFIIISYYSGSISPRSLIKWIIEASRSFLSHRLPRYMSKTIKMLVKMCRLSWGFGFNLKQMQRDDFNKLTEKMEYKLSTTWVWVENSKIPLWLWHKILEESRRKRYDIVTGMNKEHRKTIKNNKNYSSHKYKQFIRIY